MQVPNHSRITEPLPDQAESDFFIGTLLSERYIIESIIGRGSMGVVYKAMHTVIGRPVAIKTLNSRFSSEDRNFKRFTREARATSRLSHPNIITVHDAGFTPNGFPYLVMDYIEGITLADAMQSGSRPTFAKGIDIAIQVCAALAHAHEQRIIHRDLKPSNIMLVCNSQGQILVKVVDFGIAKMTCADEDGNVVTKTGEVIGTPVYMSPEQGISMPLDERSDIYSFGVVLYELLAGRPPFRGDNPPETIRKHLVEVPPPFQTWGVTNVPRDLEQIVFRCLSKRADDRYASMHELRLELEVARLRVAEQVPIQNVSTRKTSPIALPDETTEEFRLFLQDKMHPIIDPVPEDSTVALRKFIRQQKEESGSTNNDESQSKNQAEEKSIQSVTTGVEGTRKRNDNYVKLAIASAIVAFVLPATAWLWTTIRQPEQVKPQANIREVNYDATTGETVNRHGDKHADTALHTRTPGDVQSKVKSSTESRILSVKSLHASSLMQKASINPQASSSLRTTSKAVRPSVLTNKKSQTIPKTVPFSSTKTTQSKPGTEVVTVGSTSPQEKVSKATLVLPQSKEEPLSAVTMQPAAMALTENASNVVPILRNSHNNIVQLNNDGLEAMHARNYSKAIQKFEAALRLDPGYVKARHNLLSTYNNYALMLHQAGQLNTAEHFYRKALALNSGSSGSWPLLQNYAALLRATHRENEAEKIETRMHR